MTRKRPLNRESRTNQIRRTNQIDCVIAEALEQRQMLSAVPDPMATPVDSAIPASGGFPAGSASPPGYSPAQIKSAYGISGISFGGGITGTGAGQTIAIVIANDNPNLVDSTSSSFGSSDLHNFDAAFGLADPPSFTKYYQLSNSSSYTTTYQSGNAQFPQADQGWANEAALDVEWTHAIAPQANIDLVESDNTSLTDLIQDSAAYAADLPGVSEVTMSFAVSEFYGETMYDSYLVTPTGHSGVTFLAASGDNGDVGGYPAFSPNVVSVGATTLNLSGNNYGSETALNTSGGGISQYEAKPAYQFAVSQSSGFRTIPDVSVVGDKNTGLSVYDSYNGGSSTPWYKIGGTSASTPIWAGLTAMANQGRANLGLGSLNGLTQTLPRLYALNSSDFHDITSGSNGFSAGPGYDLASGLGTPIANTLVPDLAGGATVTGKIFSDPSGSGTYSSSDAGLSGYTAFIDLYHSGKQQGTDFSAVSNSSGNFTLSDLPGGTYRLSQPTPAGVDLTTAAYQTVTLSYGSTASGENIGFKPTGAASKLGFAQQPTTVIIGDTITPAITVDVEDASGGIVANDNSAVTLSVASGGGSLGGILTENAVNGVATFSDISATTTGTYTLQATDGSLVSATSTSFSVNPVPPLVGNPAQLAFAQQPFPVTAGSVISPAITVQVLDSHGNLVNTDTSAVTLSLASGSGATLGGTLTVNAVGGVATFSNISLSAPGTFTLKATDGSLTSVTSASFAVSAVVYVPSQLVLTQQPSDGFVSTALTPPITVAVEDPNGVVVTADSSAVTLAIASGPTGGTLGGTTTANVVNGVATFSNITLSEKGTYSLLVEDGLLPETTSDSFTIAVQGTLVPAVVKNTVPTSVVSGSTVRGAVVVVNETNLAPATATGVVTTTVYAKGTDGSLTPLGSISKRQTVVLKKNYLVSIPIKSFPLALDGTYQLVASVVDPTGNTSSITGTSVKVAAAYTSLEPTFTKMTLPASVIGGGKSTALAVVKLTNTGNVTSTGLTTIGLAASVDGQVSDATVINTVTRRLTIKPGGVVSVTVPFKLIPGSLNGSYQILAEVTDPKGDVTSVASGSTVAIAPGFVAFKASAFTETPTTVQTGSTITMSVNIANNGNMAATGPATLQVGVSSDGISQLAQLTTLTKNVTIPAGKSYTFNFRFKLFVAVTPGTYYPFLTYTQDGVTIQTAGSMMMTIG